MNKLNDYSLKSFLMALILLVMPNDFARAEDELVLRENIIISTNVVRVGDLFKNAGKSYGVALYRAPRPGKEGVLNATRLIKRLASFNLIWENRHALREVIIRRSSQLVPLAEIENALKKRIAAHIKDPTIAQDMDVKFTEKLEDFYVSLDATPHIDIRHLNYNPRTGRFNAVLSVSAKNERANPVAITGLAFEVTDVAVLTGSIERNQLISEGDIEIIRLPINQVNSKFATALADLAGHKAKRNLSPGRPIRKSDVSLPRLVSRGDLVTVLYEAGNLTITARGIAMENGIKGRSIRVKNPHSKRMLEAIVTGPGIVKTKPLVRNLALVTKR